MKKTKVWIGIDPGTDGGICIWKESNDSSVRQVCVMPSLKVGRGKEIDMAAIRRILAPYRHKKVMKYNAIVILEKISPNPKFKSSNLKFGAGWGMLQGICCGLRIPFILVSAATWMKKLGIPKRKKKKGAKSKGPDKKPSIVVVQKRFPDLDVRRSKQARVAHDGITDAVCLAWYGKLVEG
jgi:hypothetical protein